MPNTLPEKHPNMGLRVLSLDGGGVGALSELLILERLMYRTKTERGLDTMPSPWEYFELIGGSGTGGIIALMLGRLRLSVPEARSAYEKLRPQVKLGFTERFQASRFEEELKKIFKDENMKDDRPDACKTFVCAMNEMNMNAGLPDLFRSYDTPEEPATECMAWEAARATSATPGLFKPMEIGMEGMRQRYIDGGIAHNNPTSLVLQEARELYPSQPAVLVTSIGSGHPDTIKMPRLPSLTTIATVLKNIAMDCERIHEDNARRFRVIPNTYFHLNVLQGLQDLDPQQWEKSTEVLAHTNAYLRMQDTKAKLADLVKVLLNPVIPVSDSPVYIKVCPPPMIRFTGRDEILVKMAEYFSRNIGRRHIFLLHGLGGAGKSQIAFKFIEESAVPEPRFSEIYFVDSSSEETIENDLVTIAVAKKLGKTANDSLFWLSHQRKEWLLVFNNADDIRLNLVQYFPTGSHGNIIITSRNPDLGQIAQAEYKVDRMELEDSVDLLLSAARHDTGDPGNRRIGKQLVERLHCFPLAVAQAGAYISSSRALQKYLDLYESTTKRIQLLSQRPLQSDFEWSVYTTWQISLEQLSPRAVELLQLCSFLHHDGITEEIFQKAASYQISANGPIETELSKPLEFLAGFGETLLNRWDSLKFITLTDELGRYSLIEFQAASRNIAFSIHPLVHEWCRTIVNEDAHTEICVHRLLGMSISSNTASFRFNHQIFPHLDALLFVNTTECGRQPHVLDTLFAHQCLRVYYDEGRWSDGIKLGNTMLQSGSPQLTELRALNIQNTVAILYDEAGMYNHARELKESLLKRRTELFGQENPDTLLAMQNLAVTYAHLGEYRRAAVLQNTVWTKRIETLGLHPDTLASMENMASIWMQLGDFKLAERMQSMAMKNRINLMGEDHPDTLIIMANLAVTYSHLGDFKHAEELESTVLKKRTVILGEDHPETLRAMANLAVRYSQLGESQRAVELEEKVLAQRIRILGQDHPDTLQSTANLAATYSNLGDVSHAQELEIMVLKKRTALLGEDHADTLISMTNLAVTYSDLGDFQRTAELQMRVLKKYIDSHGKEHPDTLRAMANLAVTYSYLGQLRRTEELETTVLNKRTEILGENHPSTIMSMSNLAETYALRGEFRGAEELCTKAMIKRRELLGEDHPYTMMSMGNLAGKYVDIGQFRRAEELGNRVLKKRRKILGEDHPDTIYSMGKLGRTYCKLGELRQAEELLIPTLKKQRISLGAHHWSTLSTMVDIAETYYQQGRWDEAEGLLVTVLVRRSQQNENQREKLVGMGQLAKTYSQKGYLDQAASLQDLSGKQLEKMFGSNHPDVLEIRMHLCTTFREQGKLEEAQRLLADVATRMAEPDALGRTHPTTLKALAELATTYRHLGRLDGAQTLGQETLEKQKVHLGDEHPESVRTMASLGLTYYALGRFEEAQELQDRALQTRQSILGPFHPETEHNEDELAATLRQINGAALE
ncbi:hypothetical protein DFH09DRAFT_1284678 [Mycena vulgaris]|nr:hypothetical protein DFH09DRAFT_1284678 [Mycena vulgaris]